MSANALNERLKLLANLLNTIAAAFFTIGVASPLAAAYYKLAGIQGSVAQFAIAFAVCILCCAALHFGGRYILRHVT